MRRSKPDKAKRKSVSGKGIGQPSGQEVTEGGVLLRIRKETDSERLEHVDSTR